MGDSTSAFPTWRRTHDDSRGGPTRTSLYQQAQAAVAFRRSEVLRSLSRSLSLCLSTLLSLHTVNGDAGSMRGFPTPALWRPVGRFRGPSANVYSVDNAAATVPARRMGMTALEKLPSACPPEQGRRREGGQDVKIDPGYVGR